MPNLRISVLTICLMMLAACAGGGAGGSQNSSGGGGVAPASYYPANMGNDAYDMASEERHLDATDENDHVQNFEHHEALREHRDFCTAHPNDSSCSRLNP